MKLLSSIFPATNVLLTCAAVLLIAGCAAAPGPPIKGYDGAELPAAQLAVVDWSDCQCVCRIDDLSVHGMEGHGYTPSVRASLKPGTHAVRVHKRYRGVKGMLTVDETYDTTVTLGLKADRVYGVRIVGRQGANGYQDYLRIDDDASGEIYYGPEPLTAYRDAYILWPSSTAPTCD